MPIRGAADVDDDGEEEEEEQHPPRGSGESSRRDRRRGRLAVGESSDRETDELEEEEEEEARIDGPLLRGAGRGSSRRRGCRRPTQPVRRYRAEPGDLLKCPDSSPARPTDDRGPPSSIATAAPSSPDRLAAADADVARPPGDDDDDASSSASLVSGKPAAAWPCEEARPPRQRSRSRLPTPGQIAAERPRRGPGAGGGGGRGRDTEAEELEEESVGSGRRGRGREEEEEEEVAESMRDGVFDVSDLMTKSAGCGTRRLLVIGLAAIVVLALIAGTAVILLSGGGPGGEWGPEGAGNGISLEEWLGGSLSTKSFNGTWISGDEIFYEDEGGNLMIFNVISRRSRNVLNVSSSALVASFDHQFSADRKYLLLAFNYQRLFRHTFLAQYKIVNLETLQETLLSGNESSGLQLAVWAPKGNGLVYVLQSNIYYRPQAEVADDYQITVNGLFGTVYNGVPDWVYEEEVFGSNNAVWFSPSGTKLAFGHFDDSHTPIMNIPYYGFPGQTFQYPTAIPIHYPKSGTQNPTVKLFYVDLMQVVEGNVTLVEVESPPKLSFGERILAAVTFPTDELLSATWMNRVQNQAYFHMCNVVTYNCSTTLAYKERNGWVEQFVPPLFSKDGTAFVLILPQKQGNRGDWRHAVLVANATSNFPKVTALTFGLFVVTEIVAWDQDNHFVYYLATSEEDPAQKHLYRVSILDHNRRSECLTCGVRSESDGSYCLYNSAEFSEDSSHYALTCAGPGIPEITIHDRNSTKLYTWEGNKAVADLIAEKSRPIVKRFAVSVPGGFEAEVKLLLPPNADMSGKTKYPMLVYVYGGPDTNEVTEKFNIDWGSYLVTNKSIIYATIDGRGTGLKGNSMMFAVYRNLGTVEIMDQINVTRHLQNSFGFIDRSRTAIWGWSYGGYVTGMALAMDFNGTFKCGMSVAPVTDWTLYDSVYTERLMGLPSVTDNLGGYDQSQLLNKVDNIKNKGYYLIHGTLDDNVHYQQSMLLTKMLEQKDILFRSQTYTDETHDIARMRLHLYHSMENFLDECFKSSS